MGQDFQELVTSKVSQHKSCLRAMAAMVTLLFELYPTGKADASGSGLLAASPDRRHVATLLLETCIDTHSK